MSFNAPQNVPSFSTNRPQEDNYWRTKPNSRSNTPSSRSTSGYAYSRANNASSTNGYLDVDGSHTRKSSLKDKIGGLINGQSDHDLPLYKDKPRFPSGKGKGVWNRLFPRGKRKRWGIAGVLLFFVVWYMGAFSSSSSVPNVGDEEVETGGIWGWFTKEEIDWNARRLVVKRAFMESWDDYAQHAWGMDVYHPVSRKSSMIVKPKTSGESSTAGMGWIIVDALDTAMIMNLTSRVTQARGWIKTSLDFSQANDGISVFDTTSKVLGGLLSAYYLSTTFPTLAAQTDDDTGMHGEDLYIEKAVDLADRLLGAFDTPTGIPLSRVNLNTSTGIPGDQPHGASLAAEVAALQLEFKYVSKITGEPLYWEKAEKIMKAIDGPRTEDGLVPASIDSATAQFKDTAILLGSRHGVYYEYLLEQYLQTGSRETIYGEMWEEALAGIKKNLISFSKDGNFTVLGERVQGLKGPLSGKMDLSVCSMPGLIALGVTGGQTVTEAKARLGSNWGRKQQEDLLLAEELMKTCWAMHAVTPSLIASETNNVELISPSKSYSPSTFTPSGITFDKTDPRAHPSISSFKSDFRTTSTEDFNLQSSSTIKSLYHLYRITRHPRYRTYGWQLFQSLNKYTHITDKHGNPSGYTSLESVLRDPDLDKNSRKSSITGINDIMVGDHHVDPTSIKIDNMETWWLAETLKYFYLLFSDDATAKQSKHVSPLSQGTNVIADEWFDLSKVVFNSEGHIFPRFDIEGSKVWKTGWTRSEKKVEVVNLESTHTNADDAAAAAVDPGAIPASDAPTPAPAPAPTPNANEKSEEEVALEKWKNAENKEHRFGDVG